MALYLIGDLQGCNGALQTLLDEISFSPSRDILYFLGDLVNRGPDSVGVLRRLMRYGNAAQCVLGNHDLHLLATSVGARRPSRKDTLQSVLDAPDRSAMLDWLRHQRMARLLLHQGHTYLLVHAGVLPNWSASQTVRLAQEVEDVLQGPDLSDFLHDMYGDAPRQWDEQLRGTKRLRVVVNALTRLRFCTPQGAMEFAASGPANTAPPGYLPWFDAPQRQTASVRVAFGHWSTLGWLDRSDVIALDTGCVWGGYLSALKLGDAHSADELIQVPCPQAQAPGSD